MSCDKLSFGAGLPTSPDPAETVDRRSPLRFSPPRSMQTEMPEIEKLTDVTIQLKQLETCGRTCGRGGGSRAQRAMPGHNPTQPNKTTD